MRDLIADRYELREIIGRGASGVVAEAIDRRLGRLVAVKVMRGAVGEEERARMTREAQVAGRLSHGNIVAVHDAGMQDDLFYIVMELVIGEPLAAAMRRGGIAAEEAVGLVAELLDGLAHAHARGVVHRDVKPANILLAIDERPGPGRPKLVDFGIARTAASDLTQVGTLAGTPAYMSPEQLRGEEADKRADIWASGVILFELLAGRHPFRPPSDFFALTHAIVNRPTPALAELAPGLPPGLAAVVDTALAKHRDNRFPDADAMAAALRGVLGAMAGGRPAAGRDLPEDATLELARQSA
ncbi:serine/threonine-protein kinase [Falsiroseomonas sp. CW058]|uniref:serine/threonine-protein kinase n=1 Tax=Falsiroseomonas sp. CW058 TaxID=3388664 RepID=UPI003D31B2FB